MLHFEFTKTYKTESLHLWDLQSPRRRAWAWSGQAWNTSQGLQWFKVGVTPGEIFFVTFYKIIKKVELLSFGPLEIEPWNFWEPSGPPWGRILPKYDREVELRDGQRQTPEVWSVPECIHAWKLSYFSTGNYGKLQPLLFLDHLSHLRSVFHSLQVK